MLYSKQLIGNKPVYVVPYHNQVICAWADIRRGLGESPFLLSLDHHTDLHPPFAHYASSQFPLFDDSDAWRELATALVKEIDLNDDASVEKSALLLRNDEHIHAAREAGLIRGAFVIQYHDFSGTPSLEENRYYHSYGNLFGIPRPERPFTYIRPYNDIFVVGAECAVGCERLPHTDECTRDHADQAIETPYLDTKLNIIHEMSPALNVGDLISERFILDIDLDYFGTAVSIEPKAPELFYTLVRNAQAVTLAEEAGFVENCRLAGEVITAETLLPRLLTHLECAVAH